MSNIGQGECTSPKSLHPQSYNPLDNLKQRKNELELRLTDVNNAIKALTDNPELVKCLELLAKV